ncbi:hypothetical protein A3715_19615 [Oleiphilus sp. HI0009]|nr:hypothetical protein A3715_19615 [Oleiphilus sp. HI0009]
MTSNYDFAEPGFILIDRVNEMNNNWFCENIRATNPCGEQPLPPNGSCLLGSVNLTRFVENPFTDKAKFNYEKYKKVVSIFTRMLDNVVEINGLPLKEQRDEIKNKRRHGMGILGLGSTLTMLGMKYGGTQSIEFTDLVSKEMALSGWKEASLLAQEKGEAPILKQLFKITDAMLNKRPEMVEDGYKTGDKISGRELLVKYSRYMQNIKKEAPEIIEELLKHGARFTHHSSIAPTGTISLSIANNASNGIEPTFSHSYTRNIIREGRNTKESVEVCSFEYLAYKNQTGNTSVPENFSTTDNVTPEEHISIQAAAQKWVDSAISKTANIPTDFEYDSFKEIYLLAHKEKLKGCTTFRFNPEAFQGVLVKKEDLENTEYEFTLDDGSKIKAKGNETIVYEGEETTAANLFDALKEGNYGKW